MVPAKGMKTTKIARARTTWGTLTPTAASAGNWRGVAWGLDGGRDGHWGDWCPFGFPLTRRAGALFWY